MKKLLLLPLFSTLFLSAEIHPIVQLGRDLIVLKNPTKTTEVVSGSSIEAGIEWDNNTVDNWTTQLLLGYKKDKYKRTFKKHKPINLTVNRKYVNLMEFYKYDNFKIGAGVSLHYKGEAIYTSNKKHKRVFNNAMGGLLQAGYDFDDNWSLNVKANLIKYTLEVKSKKKLYVRKYNVSSLGVFLTYRF